MKFYSLIALLGASTAIKINQFPYDNTGLPGPANDGPQQAGSGYYGSLAQGNSTDSGYGNNTTGNYTDANSTAHGNSTDNGQGGQQDHEYSRQDEINDFANQFFDRCDADHDQLLSRKEIRECIGKVMKRQRMQVNEHLKQEAKERRRMMQQQLQMQRDLWVEVSKMVYKGASEEPGADPKKGISLSNIHDYLNKDWEQINAVMSKHDNQGDQDQENSDDHQGEPCVDQQQADDSFNAFDTNHNGSLSIEEVKNGIEGFARSMNHTLSAEEWAWLKETGARINTKNPDEVDHQEFFRFINAAAEHWNLCGMAREDRNKNNNQTAPGNHTM